MITRTAGEGRYAHDEREQRWVLQESPVGLHAPVAIVDHYISGTRLRLRRMQQDADVIYKFGQKVRPELDSPDLVKLTNMYLSEHEYSTLRRLGGAELRKTRWRWPGAGSVVVDEFAGPLTGLVLAEVELDGDEPRMTAPPHAVADVTDDDRFSGGTLAETTATALQELLASVGVRLAP